MKAEDVWFPRRVSLMPWSARVTDKHDLEKAQKQSIICSYKNKVNSVHLLYNLKRGIGKIMREAQICETRTATSFRQAFNYGDDDVGDDECNDDDVYVHWKYFLLIIHV